MTRPLAETAFEVAIALLLAFALAYQPPSAHYGMGADRLNESEYFERNVQPLSSVPDRHRAGVRAAVETGHGSAPGATSADVVYLVRHEGAVYRTYPKSVADPGPSPPVRLFAVLSAVALLAGRALLRRIAGRMG